MPSMIHFREVGLHNKPIKVACSLWMHAFFDRSGLSASSCAPFCVYKLRTLNFALSLLSPTPTLAKLLYRLLSGTKFTSAALCF
jgi:hypothetical protein